MVVIQKRIDQNTSKSEMELYSFVIGLASDYPQLAQIWNPFLVIQQKDDVHSSIINYEMNLTMSRYTFILYTFIHFLTLRCHTGYTSKHFHTLLIHFHTLYIHLGYTLDILSYTFIHFDAFSYTLDTRSYTYIHFRYTFVHLTLSYTLLHFKHAFIDFTHFHSLLYTLIHFEYTWYIPHPPAGTCTSGGKFVYIMGVIYVKFQDKRTTFNFFYQPPGASTPKFCYFWNLYTAIILRANFQLNPKWCTQSGFLAPPT